MPDDIVVKINRVIKVVDGYLLAELQRLLLTYKVKNFNIIEECKNKKCLEFIKKS